MEELKVQNPDEAYMIEHLVNVITRSAKALTRGETKAGNDYLDHKSQSHNGMPSPPLSDNASPSDDDGSQDTNDLKSTLLSACRTLMNKVAGPTETLKNMALIDKHNLASLQILNHYQIANFVPLTGSISVSDLATECRLPSDQLARILRQAMTYGVFYEPCHGYIAHTETSRELPRLAPLLTYQLEICMPSTMALLPWLKQGECENTIDAPFQIAHDTQDSWWTYAEKRPELVENYGRYMALITQGGPHDVSHVVDGYAWGRRGPALAVDIGGGDGLVGATLASAYPDLTVMTQDSARLQSSVLARATATELNGRLLFVPHSFFDPQPVVARDADVFLLRHILHDWDDARCVKILRELVACLKPGASIVVADQVLARPGCMNAHTERVMRALDMQMMVQFGGKERTLDEWNALFRLADPALKLVACLQPVGSADSFMELQL